MTQHDPDEASSHAAQPNPSPDLTQLYETIDRLLVQLAQNPSQSPAHSLPILLHQPLALVALTVHAVLLSHSFRLRSPAHSDHPDTLLATDWDALLAPDQRSIHAAYSHPHTTLSFEFTLSKIGARIAIASVAVELDKLANLDISVSEYVDPSQFPLRLSQESQRTACGFRSATHLLDFVSLFVSHTIHALAPDLFPLPVMPAPPRTSTTAPCRSQVLPDATHALREPSSTVHQPLEIGRSDLDPLGTSNIRLPPLYNGPAGPLAQPSGMFVGPDHPLFGGAPHRPGFGGDAMLPPSAVPPGARFDPIGPGLAPVRPSRFGRDPMGGLGQGLPMGMPHPGSGPDRPESNDFRPPGGPSGYDDMFM